MNLKNISTALSNDLGEIIKGKINRAIIPGESYIPVTGKVLTEEDILYGIEAVLDGWLTAGRFAEEFEREIARYLGSRFSLLVNSGSSANLLAFYTLTSPKLGERAIQPGDEIITVAAGFPTTINPLIQFGCIPVLLDIDIPTYSDKRITDIPIQDLDEEMVDVFDVKDNFQPRQSINMIVYAGQQHSERYGRFFTWLKNNQDDFKVKKTYEYINDNDLSCIKMFD